MRKFPGCVGVVGSLLAAGSAAAAVPSWTAEYDRANLQLGAVVASAGDVNGDGFDDVLLGTPLLASTRGGGFVHYGSALGPSAIPDWAVAGTQALERLGSGAAGVGDVNGDGYDDVVLGSEFYDAGILTYAGRAQLFLGSATGLSTNRAWMATGGTSGAHFGTDVAGAGDVNGDGYDDVIVGAYGTQNNTGEALLYLGSAAGLAVAPAWRFVPNLAGGTFGSSVASAGDVNGDGYDDVVIGAPYTTTTQSQEGAAWVFLGSAAGLGAQPDWVGVGGAMGTMYGSSVSGAGDVNGDGFSDIVVGQPYWLNGAYPLTAGRALVYEGSAAGLGLAPAWIGSLHIDYLEYGRAVAGGGDVNGDGYDDIVVGVPQVGNPDPGEGAALVYAGSASGIRGVPRMWLEGGGAYAAFGSAVSIAGDVNGDGLDDFLVGAPGMSHGQRNEGEARLFDGR